MNEVDCIEEIISAVTDGDDDFFNSWEESIYARQWLFNRRQNAIKKGSAPLETLDDEDIKEKMMYAIAKYVISDHVFKCMKWFCNNADIGEKGEKE